MATRTTGTTATAATTGTTGDGAEAHAHERRWAILAVLCFSLLVIVLDNSILNVAIPTLISDLEASTSQIQWILDSYTLVFAGLLLTAGSLGDRYGRRGALQVGFLLFGLGSLVSAFASDANQLIATRALMGVGAAFIMPATLAIITNVFPPHERGRAIGVWAGVAGVGIALGPLTGGFLLEHFYWGSIFLVNVPVVVLALAAGFTIIPTSSDPTHAAIDVPGAALSIAGLTALVYAIIEAPNHGWLDPRTLVVLAIAMVLLAGFLLWERRTPHPMLDVAFFRNPRFTAASLSITAIFFAMFGSMLLLTQYLQQILGFTALEAGVRMLPFAAVMVVTAPSSARLVEWLGTKVVVGAGLTIAATALALMATLEVDSGYGQLLWRMMVMALGMGLTMAPATNSIMGSLPRAKAGVGSAVNDTTRMVGGAVGVAVIGSVFSSYYGDRMGEAIAGRPVPPAAAEAVQGSLGGALDVAQRIGGQAGRVLTETAQATFVGGMHRGVLVGAAVAFLGALVALLFLPARETRAPEEPVAEADAAVAAPPAITPAPAVLDP